MKRRRFSVRRSRLAVAVLGAVVVSAALVAGGWLLADVFVSPEQQAAAALPPAPRPVTAEVESGSLMETATAQGTVEAGTTQTVPVVGGDCGIVTAQTLDAGAAVSAGTVVTEVCGRPVIALPGGFTFYRDLWPGDTGPDVTQLQSGLSLAGYDVKVDGVLGSATLGAVRALYRDAGYSVPMGLPPGDGSPASLQATVGEAEAPPAPVQTTHVPKSEFVAIAGDGGLCSRPLTVGTDLSAGASFDVISDGLVIRIDAAASGLLAVLPGTKAHATSGDTTVDVVVTAIETDPSAATISHLMVLEQTDGALPVEWAGNQVAVVLVLRDAGQQDTIVPSTAIDFASDGRAFVMRREADGSFERLYVEEVASVAGRSAVRPLDGELSVGDAVIVR